MFWRVHIAYYFIKRTWHPHNDVPSKKCTAQQIWVQQNQYCAVNLILDLHRLLLVILVIEPITPNKRLYLSIATILHWKSSSIFSASRLTQSSQCNRSLPYGRLLLGISLMVVLINDPCFLNACSVRFSIHFEINFIKSGLWKRLFSFLLCHFP